MQLTIGKALLIGGAVLGTGVAAASCENKAEKKAAQAPSGQLGASASLKQLMDAGAVNVLQPDIYWCGGISETLKICALASAYDLPVIPHGHSSNASQVDRSEIRNRSEKGKTEDRERVHHAGNHQRARDAEMNGNRS